MKMANHVGASRGSQLLEVWRGANPQTEAARLLEIDAATYNRFAHGRRRPSAEVGFQIERLTRGAVPARAWFEPPRPARGARGARRAS